MEYLARAWWKIEKKINNNNLFVFLDFDGTLTPIVSTPRKAVLPARVKKILKKLARNKKIKLAFISGRRIEDIKDKIRIKNAIYSGNHGLQTQGPEIRFQPLLPQGYALILERIKTDLREKTFSMRGTFVDDKGLSLSLHYRLADKNRIPQIKAIFRKVVKSYFARRKIKIKSGKMVLEVMPPLRWDKGRLVLWLLNRRIFPASTGRVLPIYIGDDVTDEDAFRALRKKGLTVFVGKPKRSWARYYVNNPKEVFDFLRKISENVDKLCPN